MYVEAYAKQAIDFIQCLTHVSSRWAGKPFILLKWQRVLIKKLFGTVDENGKRIYRKAYIEISKKDGKSELGAAIALYLLTLDNEQGAEVYSAACDKKQAGIVFRIAKRMVEKSEYLSNILKIIDSQKRIVYYKNNSFYEVLSSDVKTKHGFNTHGVIFDELHAQPNRDLWDVLTEGSGIAREQPLTFVMTTAGFDRNSICWEIHNYALQVIKGIKKDKHFLAMIYSLNEKADWQDEANWYKVNPSLGTKEEVEAGIEVVEKLIKLKNNIADLSSDDLKILRDLKILDIERFRDDFNEAKEKPSAINNWRRLRLNQWTSQETIWLPIEKWDACPNEIDFKSLGGKICYGGLDLSATTDLTAFVLVFPDEIEKRVLPFIFIPRERMLEKIKVDQVPYDIWEQEGYIIATEGNVVDYPTVEEKIKECLEKYQVQNIAYDDWGSTEITQRLISQGYTKMIPMRQGYKSLNAPSKYLETLILDKKLNHGGNPVLRWNFSNVMIVPDDAGNIKISKGKSKQRIDGIAALIMALDGVMKNEVTTSVYDTRSILTI